MIQTYISVLTELSSLTCSVSLDFSCQSPIFWFQVHSQAANCTWRNPSTLMAFHCVPSFSLVFCDFSCPVLKSIILTSFASQTPAVHLTLSFTERISFLIFPETNRCQGWELPLCITTQVSLPARDDTSHPSKWVLPASDCRTQPQAHSTSACLIVLVCKVLFAWGPSALVFSYLQIHPPETIAWSSSI